MSQKAKKRYERRIKAKRKEENKATKSKPKVHNEVAEVSSDNEVVVEKKPVVKPKRLEKKNQKKGVGFIEKVKKMPVPKRVFWATVIIAVLDMIGLLIYFVNGSNWTAITSSSLYTLLTLIPFTVCWVTHYLSLVIVIFMLCYCLYKYHLSKDKYWLYALAVVIGIILVNDITIIVGGLVDNITFGDCMKIMFHKKFVYGWFVSK